MNENYRILGVPENSTVGEIKRAYRTLAKHFHPDNTETGNAEKFRLLNAAYNAVLDSKPPTQRVEKATPKPDLSKYIDRNRIFRILDGDKEYYKITYPNPNITDDTVFHFMHCGISFDVFVDAEVPLPTKLTVKRNNKPNIIIDILEGYE